MLLLGVEDKTRDIEGIPLEKLDIVENFVQQICSDSIKPPLVVKIVRMELPDAAAEKKPVLKIDIPRSLFVHESPGGYYRRQGSSKRRLNPDLLARLFQQRSQVRMIRFDEQPVPGTSPETLDENLWKRFAGVGIDEPAAILKKLRLIAKDQDGKEKATVGGLLMCAAQPQTFMPGAFIEAVRYRGNRRDSNYQLDARSITGPLDHQIMECLSFVKRNMTIAAVKEPARIEIPQFSMRAVFEAVVNAVAHRDYSIHG